MAAMETIKPEVKSRFISDFYQEYLTKEKMGYLCTVICQVMVGVDARGNKKLHKGHGCPQKLKSKKVESKRQ